MNSYCDSCDKPERQLTVHIPPNSRLLFLCGDCWRWAQYWDSIAPKMSQPAEKMAA